MNSPLVRSLVRFGFSDKEARVYLALLELSTASASEVSRKAGINRSSTYVVLEGLKRRNFVTLSSNDEGLQQYVAAAPEVILRIAMEKVKEEKITEDGIREIFPELKALHKDTKSKPLVRVFEGKEATEETYYNVELLKTSPNVKEVRCYEDMGQYLKYVPGYIEKDVSEKKRLRLKTLTIYPDTEASRKVIKQYENLGSSETFTFVKVPQDKFISSSKFTNIIVSGDEIWFDSLKESYCINIKKQEIADTLKNLFDLAFAEAKRLDGKKG